MTVECFFCKSPLEDDLTMEFDDITSAVSEWAQKYPTRKLEAVGYQCSNCHESFCKRHNKELKHNFISGFEKSICPNCGLPLKRILHIFHSIEKGEQVQLDKQPTRQTVNETELHDLFVQESEKPETKDTKPLSKELKLVLGIIISISSIGLLTPLLVEEFGLPIVRMAILEITFLVCLMVSIWAWLIKNNRVRYTSTRKKGIKIALFLITGFCVGVPIFNIIRVLVLTAINVGNWEDPSLAGGVVVGGLPIPLSGASINFLLLGGMYVFLISIIFGLVSLLIKTYQTIIKDF